MKKEALVASSILIGTVVGAGILGIPYVIARAGFLTGLISILFVGVAILIMNLYLGEVTLRTKGLHQLTGYAEKYLGKWGKGFMTFSMVVGIYGALIAYFIGEGIALNAIFGLNPLIASIGFYIIFSILIYFGIKTVGNSELIMTFLKLALFILFCIIVIPRINYNNLMSFNINQLFLPYGVILFAYIGTAAIPEMREELIKNSKYMKRAILIGSIIPLIVYLLFTFAIVGVTGLDTKEVATTGIEVLGKSVFVIANLFAIFAMATSFLGLGLALKEMYQYDYKINATISWLLTVSIPIVIMLLGAKNFIQILGFTGAISGGVDGILIVWMFHRAKKMGERKPEYKIKPNIIISAVLILLFIFGIVYQFL